MAEADPVLAPFGSAIFDDALPFGAPAFDRIATGDFLPAFHAALAEARAEVDAIAADPAPPTFGNTVEALERAGARLSRVRRIFWTVSSAQSTPEIRALEGEVSALLTAHGTAVAHDPRLFARVRSVWEARATLDLPPDAARLLDDSHRGFADGGALLAPEGKARFAAIAQELAALSTRFGQNVLAANAGWTLRLDPAEAEGLPEAMLAAGARRAEAAGVAGHLVTLDRGEVEAFLSFSLRRDLREAVWRAFTGRCQGGPHDNTGIVDAILALRREQAALLGHACYADWSLVGTMAATPAAAAGLMDRVWRPALARAAAERATLQALADADGIAIAGWDWRFYAERVRREAYALDGVAVKAALTLSRVARAAFDVAGRLHGLRFAPVDLPGWHPDVRAFAVTDEDGAPRGLLYTDFLARPEKHGGAWMGSLRVQERLDAPVLPIAYVVTNFAAPPSGGETGLSVDEARTLFHEFGHALHGLLSDVTFPSQSGTAVARDFVEFPSKLNEHWIVAPEVLELMGVAPALAAAIGRADAFGEGFATVEFLASAILDLELHRQTDDMGAAATTQTLWARIGLPDAIPPRHGLAHFTHVFDGGYASQYYSYLWAEVLDADAWEAFGPAPFDPALAARLRAEVLARGDTRDPMASFVAFRGRAPDEAALLRARGLSGPAVGEAPTR